MRGCQLKIRNLMLEQKEYQRILVGSNQYARVPWLFWKQRKRMILEEEGESNQFQAKATPMTTST